MGFAHQELIAEDSGSERNMEHCPFHEQVAGVTQNSRPAGLSPCSFYPYLQDFLPYARILLKEFPYHRPDGLVVSPSHRLLLHRCYHSLFHLEQRMVSSHRIQYRVKVFAIGVCDKGLSERFATDQLDDLFHSHGV